MWGVDSGQKSCKGRWEREHDDVCAKGGGGVSGAELCAACSVMEKGVGAQVAGIPREEGEASAVGVEAQGAAVAAGAGGGGSGSSKR
jgi:hypothetical protein